MGQNSAPSGTESTTRRWMDAQARIGAMYNLPQSTVTQVVAGLGLQGYTVIEDERLAGLAVDASRGRVYWGPAHFQPNTPYEQGDVVEVAQKARRSFWEWLLRRPARVERVRWRAIATSDGDR